MSNLPITICAVLTCFNRKEKTLECIRKLKTQETTFEAELKIIVVDDGSSDGTAQAISDRYPDVEVLHGDGSLYWNGGMRMGIDHAASYTPNFFLWVNDDTILYHNALQNLLTTFYELNPDLDRMPIVAGSVKDPDSDVLTYGGSVHISPWLMPLRFRLLKPKERPAKVDIFNGNCVLVPFETYALIGNLHPNLIHDAGDYEYGLRAKRVGITCWICPGYIGTCTTNPVEGTWLDPELPLSRRYRLLLSVKGNPPGPRFYYYKSYGGPLWFLIYPLIYVRPLLVSLRTFFKSDSTNQP
jgi:GT2 family glycosyltransferase